MKKESVLKRVAKKINTLSIRSRVIASFSVVLFLLIIMSVFVYSTMNAISNNDKEIDQLALPIMMEATTINNGMLQINTYLNEIANTTLTVSVKKLERDIHTTIEDVEESRKRIEPLIVKLGDNDVKSHYNEFLSQWDNYKELTTNAVKSSLSGDHDVAKDEAFKSIAYFDRANISISSIVDTAKERIADRVAYSVYLSQQGIIWVILVSFSAIIITVALVYITLRMITKPLAKISHQVNRVASGDFTVPPLAVQTNDELGRLTNDFNKMTESLRGIFKEVKYNIKQVNNTAAQLSANAEETKAGINQVAASIHDVSTDTNKQYGSMEIVDNYMFDITKEMEDIEGNIKTVTDLSAIANRKASKGQTDIDDIIDSFNEIEWNVKESVNRIDLLENKTSEIDTIVQVIKELASQTNLLALNATIEAARAGEAGRGFAVVANEVKKLANQSAEATTTISMLIEAIQQETQEVIKVMRKTNDSTDNGKVVIKNTGGSFLEIVDATANVSKNVNNVLLTMEKVTSRTNEISNRIKQVGVVTKQSSANAESVSGISQEVNASFEDVSISLDNLSEMSNELNRKVDRYVID